MKDRSDVLLFSLSPQKDGDETIGPKLHCIISILLPCRERPQLFSEPYLFSSISLSRRHLRELLLARALSVRYLHRILPTHLYCVHGGKWSGVLHCAKEQEHAYGHQSLHSQPGHQ